MTEYEIRNKVPRVDKYDKMAPDELLRMAFRYNELDMKAAVEVLKGIERDANRIRCIFPIQLA